MVEECIFCQIIKGEAPAEFVYQDEEMVAFRDIHPKAPVHLLIVPKKHLPRLEEAGEEDQRLLGKMLLVAKKIAQEQKVAEAGYRLSINNGESAGQIIPHLHIHLLAGRTLNLG